MKLIQIEKADLISWRLHGGNSKNVFMATVKHVDTVLNYIIKVHTYKFNIFNNYIYIYIYIMKKRSTYTLIGLTKSYMLWKIAQSSNRRYRFLVFYTTRFAKN